MSLQKLISIFDDSFFARMFRDSFILWGPRAGEFETKNVSSSGSIIFTGLSPGEWLHLACFQNTTYLFIPGGDVAASSPITLTTTTGMPLSAGEHDRVVPPSCNALVVLGTSATPQGFGVHRIPPNRKMPGC